MQFINPYVSTNADPAAHTCQVVSPQEVGALTYGLSYNTYFNKFIAVGVRANGFYYSLSDDLIRWTPAQFMMRAEQTFASNPQPPFYPYPSLVDPDSPSRSFDVTGQTPYLYYSRFNNRTAIGGDVMRVRIRFSK